MRVSNRNRKPNRITRKLGWKRIFVYVPNTNNYTHTRYTRSESAYSVDDSCRFGWYALSSPRAGCACVCVCALAVCTHSMRVCVYQVCECVCACTAQGSRCEQPSTRTQCEKKTAPSELCVLDWWLACCVRALNARNTNPFRSESERPSTLLLLEYSHAVLRCLLCARLRATSCVFSYLCVIRAMFTSSISCSSAAVASLFSSLCIG